MKILIFTVYLCYLGNILLNAESMEAIVETSNISKGKKREEYEINPLTKYLFDAIDKKINVIPLIELGADLNDTSFKKIPVLAYAIEKGNSEAAEVLLPKSELHISFNEMNYLHLALKKENLDLFDKIFDICKEKNTLWGMINAEDSNKNTPFHLAAYFLLKNIKNVPLVSNIVMVLKKLKEAKGDMEKENKDGKSVIAILREAQDAITKHRQIALGWSQLHIAMKGNDLTLEGENFQAMKEAYEKHKLYINNINHKGTTPFLIVAYKFEKFKKQGDSQKSQAMLDLLKDMKEEGARLDIKNQDGVSVQMLLDSLNTKL